LYSLAKRMEAIKGYYGAHKRPDNKQGSVFWFAIPYRPDNVVANFLVESSYIELKVENNRSSLTTNPTSIRTVRKSDGDEVTVKPHHLTATLHDNGRLLSVPTKRKILLVDDSPTIVRMMSMMLTRQGYEVIVAENGMLALEKIQAEWNHQEQQEPESSNNADASGFALVLMDMQMPVMDGIEATKRLRLLEEQHSLHRSSSLTIIGMSANADEDTKQAALTVGLNEFVTKPISMALCSQLIAKYVK